MLQQISKILRLTSIRSKLAVIFSLLIAGISLFIFLFFPAWQKKQAIDAVSDKAASIARMSAYSISPGLYFDDTDAVNEVIKSALQNKDILYIEVLNDSNRVFAFGGYKIFMQSRIDTSVREKIFLRNDDIYQVSPAITYNQNQIGRLILGFSLMKINKEISNSKTAIATLSLMIFIVGFLAVFALSAIITRPLYKIVETVGHISRGDLTQRAAVASDDEIGNLAMSFNHMVDNLQLAKDDLENLNKTLENRVSERTRELRGEINERKKTEFALRASETNYRMIFDAANDAIFVHDIESGAILDANQEMCKMYGYSITESKKLNVEKISAGIPPYTQKEAFEKIQLAASGKPQLFEWLNKRQNGELFWGEVSLKKAEIGGFIRVLAVVRDITERKQTDELLRHSEEKYRSLIENITDGVLTTDNDDNILFANIASSKIFGYGLDELHQMNLKQLVTYEDAEKIQRESDKRQNGFNSQFELIITKKDGLKCQVLISASPRFDGNERPNGSIYVCTDVTSLKIAEAEKQDLREKLARAQKMESLGVLAGGVAHDLNNILGPLVAYPEVIRMKLPPDSPALNYIGKIEQSAQRAAEVVQDLLTMARRGRYEMVPLKLNEVITNYLQSPDFANHRLKYPLIDLTLELEDSLPQISGSSSHLSKVIMNLILNAFEAMPAGGKLIVKTQCMFMTKLIDGFVNIEPRKYAILTISDTGIGIGEKDLKRIFEPFYSKKEMGKSGSGLGLAIVYGVIKDHNGYIDVKSEIGKGSEFYVYFPVVEYTIDPEEQEVIDIRGNENVLIVDDICEQRELAATILSSIGYRVATAANGREAVNIVRSSKVDIVILDMIMEDNFDGLDTYREIIKSHPGQKAIIASGYAETDRVIEAERLGVVMYVRKPYTMQKLGKAIREVLSKKSKVVLEDSVVT